MMWLAFAYEALALAHVYRDQGLDDPLTLVNKLIILLPFLLLSCWAVAELVQSVYRMRKDK